MTTRPSIERINLGDELRGAWEYSIFTTFGVDFSFFERAVLPYVQRGRGCLVLANSEHMLAAQSAVARQRLVRRLNYAYAVGGVTAVSSAHAKLVLLASEERGRLLVGSGNLGVGGWASVGEMFTKYDFPDASDSAPFSAVRELLLGLRDKGMLDPAAGAYLTELLEKIPWLDRELGASGAVRHNLAEPLLDQLEAVLKRLPGEVEEVVAFAAFHDPKAAALDELLSRLAPRKALLYVQPRQTSTDPKSLERIRSKHPYLRFASMTPHEREHTYLHAKLILVRKRRHAVCLQGSANLSKVALLQTVDDGNVEAANLLVRKRDEFDHLFGALALGEPTTSLTGFDLRLLPIGDPEPGGAEGIRLISVRWDGSLLHVRIRGEAFRPGLGDVVALRIGDELVETELNKITKPTNSVRDVVLRPKTKIDHLMARAIAIAIVVSQQPGQSVIRDEDVTNPAYCFNQGVLYERLTAQPMHARLRDIGDLTKQSDEALIELVRALEATMVVDARTLIAAHPPAKPIAEDDDGDGLRLAYADVDFEAIRASPRIRQYELDTAESGQGARARRLQPLGIQLALRAITDAFADVVTATATRTEAGFTSDWGAEEDEIDDDAVATEGDFEAAEDSGDEAEPEELPTPRQWSDEARLRRHWYGFCDRFLKGLSTPAWAELVGPFVIAGNYQVFSHILQRLHLQPWRDIDYLLDAQVRSHSFIWGRAPEGTKQAGEGGWLRAQTTSLAAMLDQFAEAHLAPRLLLDLAIASELTEPGVWENWPNQLDIRAAVRDVGRAVLTHPTWIPLASGEGDVLGWTAQLATAFSGFDDEAPWRTPPTSEELLAAIRSLLGFQTPNELRYSIARLIGVPASNLNRSRIRLGEEVAGTEQLVVEGDWEIERDQLVEAMSMWVTAETHDSYRIAAGRSRLLYEAEAGELLWIQSIAADPERLGALPEVSRPWDGAVASLMEASAASVEAVSA